MRQSWASRIAAAFGIVAVLALFGGLIWLIIRGIESNPSVVGSLATAASAVVAVVAGRSFDKNRELRQAHREQIAPLYSELIENIRNAEEHDPAEIEQFFKAFSVKLIMYSPAGVIKAWIASSRHVWKQDETDAEGFILYERVLREIRKDLGHNDRNLDMGDLQRLYITDLDKVLGPFKPGGTS